MEKGKKEHGSFDISTATILEGSFPGGGGVYKIGHQNKIAHMQSWTASD